MMFTFESVSLSADNEDTENVALSGFFFVCPVFVLFLFFVLLLVFCRQ